MNNDTVPIWVASLIFGVLGILIIGSFIFAGWSISQLVSEDGVLAVWKEIEFAAEEADYEYVEETETAAELFAEPVREHIPPPSPTPEPEPEPPPAPAPRPRTVAAPAPTPPPEPVTVVCHGCDMAEIVTCHGCDGLGGGRGFPPEGIPAEMAATADLWWCTVCMGDTVVTCGTCDGAGVLIAEN